MKRVLVLILTPFFLGGACHRANPEAPVPASAAARPAARYEIAESVYDGKLQTGWEDWGWSTRDAKSGPASVDFGKWGGWIIANPKLAGRYGGLVFRMKPPEGEAELLEVRVESDAKTVFPRIKVRAEHRLDLGDGWVEVLVPMSELDPDNAAFDRIVFRAFRETPSQRTLLDKIALTKFDAAQAAAQAAQVIANAKPASLRIECRGTPKKISPWIYGVAWDAMKNDDRGWKMGATVRRWGGNPTSRYNWELKNAWNTANDWFFENVETKPYTDFLSDNAAHKASTALTLPMLGWVAKDTSSYSFPASQFGKQQYADESKKDFAGNGNRIDGKPIAPGSPTRTSIASNADFVARWVQQIQKDGQKIDIYILDNEPGLWNSTHRDVHPDPATYDEILSKTIDYGTVVRRADANALIAGPAEWGWPAYFFSAKDAKVSFTLRPDRRAHGDVPLSAWYLQKLAEHEKKTGMRLLDLFDLHFYPQGENVYTDASDAKTNALRLRQTRGLWDPSYVDESWIKEPIYLLPRMRDWIDKNYPGRGIMIGEWSFGGEGSMSGAIATAEALGRFAQHDVTAAFYWTAPPDMSPAFWGFRAYRNFDAQGGRFLDWMLPTNASTNTSIFASRDESGKHVVAIALNMSSEQAYAADVDVATCGTLASRKVWTYTGGSAGFVRAESVKDELKSFKTTLAPYSITVIDIDLASALAPVP